MHGQTHPEYAGEPINVQWPGRDDEAPLRISVYPDVRPNADPLPPLSSPSRPNLDVRMALLLFDLLNNGSVVLGAGKGTILGDGWLKVHDLHEMQVEGHDARQWLAPRRLRREHDLGRVGLCPHRRPRAG